MTHSITLFVLAEDIKISLINNKTKVRRNLNVSANLQCPQDLKVTLQKLHIGNISPETPGSVSDLHNLVIQHLEYWSFVFGSSKHRPRITCVYKLIPF